MYSHIYTYTSSSPTLSIIIIPWMTLLLYVCICFIGWNAGEGSVSQWYCSILAPLNRVRAVCFWVAFTNSMLTHSTHCSVCICAEAFPHSCFLSSYLLYHLHVSIKHKKYNNMLTLMYLDHMSCSLSSKQSVTWLMDANS